MDFVYIKCCISISYGELGVVLVSQNTTDSLHELCGMIPLFPPRCRPTYLTFPTAWAYTRISYSRWAARFFEIHFPWFSSPSGCNNLAPELSCEIWCPTRKPRRLLGEFLRLTQVLIEKSENDKPSFNPKENPNGLQPKVQPPPIP